MNVVSILFISLITAGSAWAICVLLNSIKDDIIGLVKLLKENEKEEQERKEDRK